MKIRLFQRPFEVFFGRREQNLQKRKEKKYLESLCFSYFFQGSNGNGHLDQPERLLGSGAQFPSSNRTQPLHNQYGGERLNRLLYHHAIYRQADIKLFLELRRRPLPTCQVINAVGTLIKNLLRKRVLYA